MNCYGHDTRVKIVEKYNLKCIAHIRLLKGQKIRSDAERDITNSYYIFHCINKSDNKVVESIVCGTGAARDLMKLANISAPPVFNMLHEAGGDRKASSEVLSGEKTQKEEKWDDAAKQLYNAIMILITAWNLKPGPIYDYLEEAKKYKYCTPFPNRVDKINKIIHRNKTSLRLVLKKMKQENNIRNYEFNYLEDILHKNGLKSYFEDENGR